jgi:hypothetical protein
VTGGLDRSAQAQLERAGCLRRDAARKLIHPRMATRAECGSA